MNIHEPEDPWTEHPWTCGPSEEVKITVVVTPALVGVYLKMETLSGIPLFDTEGDNGACVAAPAGCGVDGGGPDLRVILPLLSKIDF